MKEPFCSELASPEPGAGTDAGWPPQEGHGGCSAGTYRCFQQITGIVRKFMGKAHCEKSMHGFQNLFLRQSKFECRVAMNLK